MLIGSYRAMPDQTMTFQGPDARTIAGSATYGDSVYLYHATAALSLIGLVNTAIAAAESGGTCKLLDNGKIRLAATSTFTVTWTTTLLRDLLGFTQGDLSAANTYTADEISPLLWIAGTTESPVGSVLGLSGTKHHDVVDVQAPDGTSVSRTFGSATRPNEFRWKYIPQAYYQTTSDLGGELSRFFDEVLVKGGKWMLHRGIDFDSAGSSALTIPTGIGPYEMRGRKRSLGFKRAEGLERVDKAYDFRMKCLITPEYS
jgi:hypothetical protein